MINICPRCKGIIGKENICPKCGVNIIDFKEEREAKIREISNSLPSESAETEEVFSVKKFCPTCQEWQYSTENRCSKCNDVLVLQPKEKINFEVGKRKKLFCPKCKEWRITIGTFCEMCGMKMRNSESAQGKTIADIIRSKFTTPGIVSLLIVAIAITVSLCSNIFNELTRNKSSISDQTTETVNNSITVSTNTNTNTNANAYENLTNAEKKRICEYIQGRYDYYDDLEGRDTGDKYSDRIWKDVMKKYDLEEWQVTSIWNNYYSY